MTTTNLSRERADALTEIAAQLNASIVDLDERRRAAHEDARFWARKAEESTAQRSRRFADDDDGTQFASASRMFPDPVGTIYPKSDPQGVEKAERAKAEKFAEEAARLDAESARLMPRWHAAGRLAERCQAYLKTHQEGGLT
jgi:hypothetical protein